jgi:hypothetical protein
MAINPLPPAPLPTDSTSEFNSKAFSFVGALDGFVTETNALAVEVDTDASTALSAKNDAQAAAASAVAAANATKWVSGTTYTEGSVVWSPISYLSYRRKTTGAGTTDPSADSANWAPVAGTGDVTTTGTQTLTNKTLTDPAMIGTILEDVYTISDGAAFEVNPSNGSVQLITLGASRTPKATNFAAGEAITLMVDDGSAYTLTWTDATWGGTGVVWKTDGGAAPTLNTTGYTVITFWKVSTQVYGARVGNA